MNTNPSTRLDGSLRVKAATGGFQNASSSANTIVADAVEIIP